MLAGGSAWGLAATEGAMRWLEERGVGLDVRFGTLPIVPAAVLFDLADGRDAHTARCGGRAARPARPRATQTPAEGNVGAGSGARRGGQAFRRRPRDEGRHRERIDTTASRAPTLVRRARFANSSNSFMTVRNAFHQRPRRESRPVVTL